MDVKDFKISGVTEDIFLIVKDKFFEIQQEILSEMEHEIGTLTDTEQWSLLLLLISNFLIFVEKEQGRIIIDDSINERFKRFLQERRELVKKFFYDIKFKECS